MDEPAAAMDGADGRNAPWFIGALERGLTVIRAFDASAPTLRLTEVAQRTGMSRFAVRRFLRTLEVLGYVGCEQEQYFLRPKVLELGYSYLSSCGLDELVQPFLTDLVSKCDGSSSFGVLDGRHVVHVARARSPSIFHLSLGLHTRQPLHVLSIGRVLLAGMAEAELDAFLATPLQRFTDRTITDPAELRATLARERGQGWASVQDDMTYGVMAIAVPIRDRRGRVVAGVNLNPQGTLASLDELTARHLGTLQATAVLIQAGLVSQLPTFGAR